MNWKRTFGWSVLIFVAAFTVGSLLGEGALSTVAVFASSSTLYCFFLRPIKMARFRHAFAAFLVVEAIDWGIPLLLGASLEFFLSNWDSSARHLGAALLGLTVASLSSNNSFKPKPLRGSV